jgi:aryl-alcohol dehydrogenase-like predicted oxidoreductase
MLPYRQLQGVAVSALGLGCSNFGKRIDAATTDAVVGRALDEGINFFDIADVYGGGEAESMLGRALRGRRDAALVATKFGHRTTEPQAPWQRGGHPHHVVASAEASLRALGTERIDLFQLHEPDPEVHIGETLTALERLVRQGKVRWIGCSNMTRTQLDEATQAAEDLGIGGFVTVQNEYSLLVREAEREVLPYCRDRGLGFIPYFPLASGVLTGKYRLHQRVPAGTRVARMKPDKLFRFFTPQALALVEELHRMSAEFGRSPLAYAMGFLLAEPAVTTVIAGAMSPDQVISNVRAAAGGLTEAELDHLRKFAG